MMFLFLLLSRYPDEEAGEIPMAYVVRKPGSNMSEAQVIDFIAKQAMLHLSRNFQIVSYFFQVFTYILKLYHFHLVGCAVQENSTSLFYRRNP